MGRIRSAVGDVFRDLREGRNWEAYGLFLSGVTLVLLGSFDLVGTRLLINAVLVALSFIIFHSAYGSRAKPAEIEDLLSDRSTFEPFSRVLQQATDVRVYGPTAVNVTLNAGDVKRFVLDRGGRMRVIVQDSGADALRITSHQLDDVLDLARTLENSVAAMERLQGEANFSYRRLPFNPGFSLVVINADDHDGYVIFESHGFRDQNIADRMHIVIKRQDSPRWFAYWVGRFDAMWAAAADSGAAAVTPGSEPGI